MCALCMCRRLQFHLMISHLPPHSKAIARIADIIELVEISVTCFPSKTSLIDASNDNNRKYDINIRRRRQDERNSNSKLDSKYYFISFRLVVWCVWCIWARCEWVANDWNTTMCSMGGFFLLLLMASTMQWATFFLGKWDQTAIRKKRVVFCVCVALLCDDLWNQKNLTLPREAKIASICLQWLYRQFLWICNIPSFFHLQFFKWIQKARHFRPCLQQFIGN